MDFPTITLKLVPANPDHYKAPVGSGLRYGIMYFLRRESGVFDTKPYYTHEDLNINEFRRWFRLGMVYEPVSLHADVEIIHPENSETDGNTTESKNNP